MKFDFGRPCTEMRVTRDGSGLWRVCNALNEALREAFTKHLAPKGKISKDDLSALWQTMEINLHE
jgi:hypothetical protein